MQESHERLTSEGENAKELARSLLSRPAVAVESAASFPTSAGVYLIYKDGGEVIYVGKGVNLQRRICSDHLSAELILIMHSDTDVVNPVDGARRIFAVAHEPKQLTILHGYPHNALCQDPTEGWWQPVFEFMARNKNQL